MEATEINPIYLFDLLKFIPLILILTIAAFQDLNTGEAKNTLWLYTPIGLTLTLIELYFMPSLAVSFGTATALTVILSLMLFYVGAWGGADTKAFLMIAVSAPLTPILTGYSTITALTTLAIAALSALPVVAIKRQKTIRYLPFILIGVIGSLLV